MTAKLQSLIERTANQTGRNVREVLSDLLRYIIGNFNPEPKPDPLWPYKKEQNRLFHDMLCEWLAVMRKATVTREWYDPWGDLFMALTPKGGARGQFFTPEGICDLMADTSIATDVEPKPTSVVGAFGRRVTISDPTCGSGRNLLAAHAKFIRKEWRKPFLVGEDLDLDCCRMTAINLMAHGCFGEVVCHNTLTEPESLRVGFVIDEGMYPMQPGVPTIRIFHEPQHFWLLRP